MMFPKSDKNYAIKAGLLTTVVLIAYFLFMRLVGLAHHVELRLLNGAILFLGLYMAIRHMRHVYGNSFSYEKGWFTGLFMSLTTTISFTAFVWLYIAVLNPSFLAEIQQNERLGQYITRFSVPIAIGIESFASGMGFTFIWLQYFKVSHFKKVHTKPTSKGV